MESVSACDWLDFFPNFWEMVLLYFEEDPDCKTEQNFRVTCKYFNEIFMKNAYFKIKHFVLNPHKRLHADIEFLLTWTQYKTEEYFNCIITTANGSTTLGAFWVDTWRPRKAHFLSCQDEFHLQLGIKITENTDIIELWRTDHKSRTNVWRINNLDAFLQIYFPRINALPFSLEFRRTETIMQIFGEKIPDEKDKYVNFRTFCFLNPSKSRLLVLKSELEEYNKMFKLWS